MASISPQTPRQPEAPNGNIKLRKRKRAHTGCLSGVVYFILILAVSFGLAVFGWSCANEVLALNKDEVKITINVPEGFTVNELAQQLRKAQIIEHEWLFKLYANMSDADEKIKPGRYEIRSTLDYRALVYAMSAKSEYREVVRVTFREGLTLKQVLALLEENEVATAEKLTKSMENDDFNYSFLVDVPKGPNRLEGFLYPDTYDFYINEDPKSVLRKFLLNFDSKLTDEFRQRVQDTGYTLAEILTVASLVQMEAIDDIDERKNIASVIYNRLNNWEVPKLQIDATVQYALPERKERLYESDLAFESPYNTYLYPGLPPGPICSPALDSIRSALYPSSTKYYYYALTKDGTHKFSRTGEEHEKVKRDNPEIYGN